MNGVLYKDLVNLKSTLKYLTITVLIFCIVFIPMGNEPPMFIILAMYGAAAVFCFAAGLRAQTFLPLGHADLLGISPLVWWMGIMGGALLMLDIILAVYYRYRVNIGVFTIIVVLILPNLAVYVPHLLVSPMSDGIAAGLAGRRSVGHGGFQRQRMNTGM